MNDDSTESVMKTVSNVIQIDEERVKGHLVRVVRCKRCRFQFGARHWKSCIDPAFSAQVKLLI